MLKRYTTDKLSGAYTRLDLCVNKDHWFIRNRFVDNNTTLLGCKVHLWHNFI